MLNCQFPAADGTYMPGGETSIDMRMMTMTTMVSVT